MRRRIEVLINTRSLLHSCDLTLSLNPIRLNHKPEPLIFLKMIKITFHFLFYFLHIKITSGYAFKISEFLLMVTFSMFKELFRFTVLSPEHKLLEYLL